MDEQPRRIPVVDRRVSQQMSGSASGDVPSPAGPDASAFGLGADGPSGNDPTPPAPSADALSHPGEGGSSSVTAAEGQEEEAKQDFLDDLRRLQADFDNYRKRMMREQAASAGRATARLMEQLLPVLDDFDRALEHDEGGSADLLYKSLRSVLEAAGLEEIVAEGVPFDPHVHEAVDSREDAEVQEIECRSVFRRGYRLGEQILRPAMVVVARPVEDRQETADPSSEVAEG